ncbi:condensation domain-containing protein [Oceanospirillum beijerinckii]|uniref:condensation domain-containing protein n=1 Tax=Oceanospirillum beijerinckii TaxID=64976 RepID=UPI00041ADD9E|nr:condensation domain-containing protein [Oceanospirillum beijerinckii]
MESVIGNSPETSDLTEAVDKVELSASVKEQGPLNNAQQRLWFLCQTQGDPCQFNLVITIDLQGAIDCARLERAIDLLVERHPAYRSRIQGAGNGQQVVLQSESLVLDEEDLSAMPVVERDARLAGYVQSELRTPFDLTVSTAPRWQLFKVDADRYQLVMTVHHIVFDGQSLMVTMKELAELYSLSGADAAEDSSSQGQGSGVSGTEDMTLIDYALWEQSEQAIGAREESLRFWQPRLRDFPESLSFPEVNSGESGAGAYRSVLDRNVLKVVRKWAHAHNLTPFALLKAAFDLVVFRYSGQSRFLVGTDIAGRELPGLARTTGFFINQLSLPCEIDAAKPVLEWLQQIDSDMALALSHKDVPFDRLVAAQAGQHSGTDTPLFQVKMNYQQRRARSLRFADAKLMKHRVYQHTGPYHLVLDLVHEEDGITAEFEYQQRFFGAQKIQLVAGQWQRVLENLDDLVSGNLAEADARLAEWERKVLSEQQRSSQQSRAQQRPVSSLRARGGRRQAVAISSTSLVKESFIDADRSLPLVIEQGDSPVNLIEWARENQPMLERRVLEHGSILFRGFDVSSLDEFDHVVSALSPGALEYMFRASPRSRVDGNIYTSTDYPADQPIFLHNEHSYSPRFPLRLFFYCHNEAATGGETPIGCVREITRRVPEAIKEKFKAKGVRYVRNYGDGFGLPWQSVFQTEDQAEVEAYCDSMGISYEWKEGGRLRTFQWGGAMMKHPRTNEELWFNHATFFHVTTLPAKIRDSLMSDFGAMDLPTNTFYGDGSPVEPEVLEQLRTIYREATVMFPWKKGDVLFMDNMLNVHGRTPYTGPRKVMVAMAEAQYGKDLVIGDTE